MIQKVPATVRLMNSEGEYVLSNLKLTVPEPVEI